MKAPFGTWHSPITSDLIIADTISLSSPIWHQGNLLWVESRPQDAGRNVLVLKEQDGSERDINLRRLIFARACTNMAGMPGCCMKTPFIFLIFPTNTFTGRG